MKIVFLAHSLVVGGAETVVVNYLVRLKGLGHEVALIENFKVDTFLRERLLLEKISIFTINKNFGNFIVGKITRRLYRIFFGYKRLNKIIKDLSPDIVHCHTNSFKLHKIKFSPLFYTFHTDVKRTFKISDKWFESSLKKALKKNVHIIALSEKIKRQTLEICSFADVTVIPNGVDVDLIKTQKYDRTNFLKELRIPCDAFILGHVGRFHPVKNHEKILEIFEEVHIRKPNSYLLLIGDVNDSDREAVLVRKAEAISNVIFLGERKDATSVMSIFDCFVLPSFMEGFPMVLCEAEAQKIRCIVSSVVPNEAIVNDNCFTLNVDESSQKWADYVLGDFVETRHKTLDDIDIKNVIGKHVSIYQKVLGSIGIKIKAKIL